MLNLMNNVRYKEEEKKNEWGNVPFKPWDFA